MATNTQLENHGYDLEKHDCGGKIIIDNAKNEKLCTRCGEIIDQYTLNTHHKNTVEFYTRLDRGLYTSFDLNDMKKSLKYPLFKRLLKVNTLSKLKENKERNINQALIEIDRVSSILNLPNVVKEKASQIYRQSYNKKYIKGRNINNYSTACVYTSCRLLELPINIKQLVDVTQTDKSHISKAYRTLISTCSEKPSTNRAEIYIPKITGKLNLNLDVERRSLEILKREKNRGNVTGRNPNGVAAAVVYLACREMRIKVNQRKVAEAADSSEVTVRKRIREIKKP